MTLRVGKCGEPAHHHNAISWHDREATLRTNLGLVHHVLRRMGFDDGFSPVLDKQDLLSFGIMGLLEAIDRFDASRGVRFQAYAAIRIRGAILDGIRTVDPVPRVTRRRQREIERSWAQLAGSLGREPTADEVCDAARLTAASYRETVAVTGRVPVSLDRAFPSHGESAYFRDLPIESEFENIEREQLLGDLARAVGALPERELLVVSLYYQDGLRFADIALALGVSASRVHQLHARALQRLRASLRARYAA